MEIHRPKLFLIAVVLMSAVAAGADDQKKEAGVAAAPIKPVPISAVHLDDKFWSPRLEVVRTVTIPATLDWCEKTGRVDNFVRAAAALGGQADADKKLSANPQDDADLYKAIEAASYTLAVHPDPALDSKLDALIGKIAAAQEKDGYLYTARTIDPEHPNTAAGAERWSNEKLDSYELSNLGYLYLAATAHFQATGKHALLNVAIRSADLLDSTFGPDKKLIWPGHEVVELGLVSLSQATGEKRYLNLAKFFIDQRGPDDTAGSARARARLNQSQQKVIDQTAATGNVLDAMHLYCGMADLAANTGDSSFTTPLDKIWNNVVGQKLFITGGIPAAANDGSFQRNYALSNAFNGGAANAAVASELWNQRMFQLLGDAKYIDVFERTLYNQLLAGVSLDGKRFFDTILLESLGRPSRREPSINAAGPNNITSHLNLARFIAALPEYIYATQGDSIYVNLYAAGAADIKLDNGRSIKVVQQTNYPWDGAVQLKITPDQRAKFSLNLRIPSWARDEPIFGELYSFTAKDSQPVVLKVNGKEVNSQPTDKGYVTIDREWSQGDVVELTLPMPIHRVQANDQVIDNRGRFALERGPVVYCLEAPSNEKAKVRNLVLSNGSKLDIKFEPELLGGVEVIAGNATALNLDEQDQLQRTEQAFIAIPYYAWGNRGSGEMLVWIPNIDSAAVPVAAPNRSSSAKISASRKQAGQAVDGRAAMDGIEPRSSHDNTPLSHFDWWPDRNVTEWCEYAWEKPVKISQTQVYWWDDSTTGGGCKVPVSWKALYKDGDEWKPVETSDTFGIEKDQFNKVKFKPIETTGLRLEIVIRNDASMGIQEWKVR